MNLSKSTTKGMPTRDDLYEAAMVVEQMSAITGILSTASANENEFHSAMGGISWALKVASDILAEGLDVNGGTFGNLKKAEKAS